MLENLLQLVKENAGEAIVNNPAIPNEKNDEAISHVSNSIFDSLKNQLAGGNSSQVMELLNGSSPAANSPVVNNISSDAISSLMAKFGLSSSAASNIVSSILPNVMRKFVSKTNDPNDNSFDLKGILGSLTGGASGGIGSVLGKLFS